MAIWEVPLIGGLTNIFQSWIDGRNRKKELKLKIEEAKVTAHIKRLEDSDEAASELDMLFVQSNGIKDDISFYLFLIPLVMCFFPQGRPIAEAGFQAISILPEWYQYSIAGMLIAVWGYRRVLQAFINKKIGNLIDIPKS